MTGLYHAVVRIDQHEARVFHFNRTEVKHVVVRPDHPTRHIHHKAGSIGSGHAAEDQNFYYHVSAALAAAEAILITGPANAKTELVKHIHTHEPRLVAHIAGIETVDHLSDKSLGAYARNYFRADHQVPLRS